MVSRVGMESLTRGTNKEGLLCLSLVFLFQRGLLMLFPNGRRCPDVFKNIIHQGITPSGHFIQGIWIRNLHFMMEMDQFGTFRFFHNE